MKAFVHRLGWLLCLCGTAVGAAAHGRDIEIPGPRYLGTERLLTLYEPLRRHLQEAVDLPVRVITSPDYRSFVADVAQAFLSSTREGLSLP